MKYFLTQPTPKTKYANSKHSLRPKISLSLPYSGWKEVKVRKKLVRKVSM